MGVMEVLAFSLAAGAFSFAIFSDEKVKKLEQRVKELEDNIKGK
ncbi:hypothetical protein QGM71_21775 [Virgibacillus sp. C22-A2]|uniref:YrzO family protein n=1 Tax=Virgibacillus tibetensis TaxID=3042313 RepID=A0ABU6KLA2_9BACI|nr:hypothetical protein [Virgibacillus sp. C22-A2]